MIRLPEKRLPLRAGRERGAHVGDRAERSAQDRGGGDRSHELCAPVTDRARPGEVARERERERHRGVEVGTGDVPDRIDHRHDHQPERDRHAHVPERMRLRVDHHRAGAGEDERERADRFRDQRPSQRPHGQLSPGSSSPINPCTRWSISSRMRLTASRSLPSGSSRLQSS